jgi:AMP nucleosidase
MEKRIKQLMTEDLPVITPAPVPSEEFADAKAAVDRIKQIYATNTQFLRDSFAKATSGRRANARYRACYPEITITTTSHGRVDSRLAFGYVGGPGVYSTTITDPKLFSYYLKTQIGLLLKNHGVTINVATSDTPIPLHFAFLEDSQLSGGSLDEMLKRPLRDVFDVPDLSSIDDKIVNSKLEIEEDAFTPLAPFTAQRIDYSLHRLSHYTATKPRYFQNFVLFTNYQFYIDEFIKYAKEAVADPDSGYLSFVEPGNHITRSDGTIKGEPAARIPQMPAYHMTRRDKSGITMVNIGVGPSNAISITDHVAVMRPHTLMML